MKHALLFILIFSAIGILHAEIPLVLETTIQLPTSGPWDVQHWMSDSTFGWAYLSSDTIVYCQTLRDSIRRFVVPDSIFAPYHPQLWGIHQRLMLSRSTLDSTHLFVLLQSRSGYSDDDFIVFSTIDLTTGRWVEHAAIDGNAEYYGGMYYRREEATLGQTALWPMPPEPSQALLAVRQVRSYTETDVYGGWSTDTRTFGTIYSVDLGMGNFHSNWISYGDKLDPFVHSSGLRFTLSGSLHDEFSNSSGNHTILDSCWINSYDGVTGLRNAHDAPLCQSACAQEDADETERIITIEGFNVCALQPETYQTLWQNPDVRGDFYTARLAISSDELFLTYRSQRFAVYNASTGEFMDSTSLITGDLKYLIKHANQLSEIVTFDSTTQTVRVYGSSVPDVAGLTIMYIAVESVLRLDWLSSAGATHYYVYSSPTPGTIETLEAIVSAPEHSMQLPVQAVKRFYCVTAEYGAR